VLRIMTWNLHCGGQMAEDVVHGVAFPYETIRSCCHSRQLRIPRNLTPQVPAPQVSAGWGTDVGSHNELHARHLRPCYPPMGLPRDAWFAARTRGVRNTWAGRVVVVDHNARSAQLGRQHLLDGDMVGVE
jgi:hypothetical protein